MEWVFIIGLLLFFAAKQNGKKKQEALAKADKKFDQEVERLTKDLVSTAKIDLTTPQGKGKRSKTKPEPGYEYVNLAADQAVTINGKASSSIAEDCAACGTSFVILWVGPLQKQPLQKAYCPLCGKIHYDDQKKQAVADLCRVLEQKIQMSNENS